MAYIPPHKRQSMDMAKPSLTPAPAPAPAAELVVPQFRGIVNRYRKVFYANRAISKWFSVGSTNDGNRFPSCVNLEPFSEEFIERIWGEKLLALVNTTISQGDEGEVGTQPWESIVENVLLDLLSSVERVKNEMKEDLEKVKSELVVRLGKVLFKGSTAVNRNQLPTETTLREMRRAFYTNIPGKYLDIITEQVIPLTGVEFKAEKDIYYVKLSDAERPDATVICKCIALPQLNNLELCKIELNKVRYMVVDVSCLKENVDARLMLGTKKILTVMTDDEMESIVEILKSAFVDQDVKGGLRWRMGRSSSENRFKVIGICHTVTKSYVNPFLKLYVRNADYFNYTTSMGEATSEVTFKLKQVTSKLLGEKDGSHTQVISDILNDQMKMIWNFFVRSASFSA